MASGWARPLRAPCRRCAVLILLIHHHRQGGEAQQIAPHAQGWSQPLSPPLSSYWTPVSVSLMSSLEQWLFTNFAEIYRCQMTPKIACSSTTACAHRPHLGGEAWCLSFVGDHHPPVLGHAAALEKDETAGDDEWRAGEIVWWQCSAGPTHVEGKLAKILLHDAHAGYCWLTHCLHDWQVCVNTCRYLWCLCWYFWILLNGNFKTHIPGLLMLIWCFLYISSP